MIIFKHAIHCNIDVQLAALLRLVFIYTIFYEKKIQL